MKSKERYLIENKKEFDYLIEEGDNWISKRNWNNSIYFYKKAIEIFPNEFEANYRLALAYYYNCKFENEDCKKGEILTIKLLEYASDNKELIEHMHYFKNNNVTNSGYNSLLDLNKK